MIAEQQHNTPQNQSYLAESGHFESSFPPDRRLVNRTLARAQARASIRGDAWSKFKDTCGREGLKAEHALVGLLQILLHRYSVADSIGIGVLSNSFLPVSTGIDCDTSVRRNIESTSVGISGAFPVSAAEIRALSSDRGSEQPVFRVLLSLLDSCRGGTARSLEALDGGALASDVTIHLSEWESQSDLVADYAFDLYKPQTIERVLSQFCFLIESFGGILEQPVNKVPLCPLEELVGALANTATQSSDLPLPQCMHRRFEDQVLRTPNAVALVMPGEPRQEITYSQLNTTANRLAHYLRSRGVGPDVLVGLYLDRTPNLVVGLLAILKAGGAYLPIDLAYPQERVAFMLSDAEAPIVITDSETACNLGPSSTDVVCIDTDAEAWSGLSAENPHCENTPDNLIYSIFTSGSTGKPKGVLITHANVSRLFDATNECFHFNEQDAWTFFHSSAFDFSVWEIWGALIYGGRVVIVPFSDSRSPERFHELLASERVTILNQTPSAFRQLIGVDEKKPAEKVESLRYVIFGGEALNLQSLAPWFKKYGDAHPQLVNMYGITETTVHVTYRPLKFSDLTDAPGSVIGVPIPDLQVYVLDAGLQPVPVGIPGELFVGGGGVARGYLKRDALTAERFIQNPFAADGKLYRTGDLAKRLPDGDLEYLGRADQQVKIRGFRIELGEVQSALTKQSSVREAFVTAKETCNGEKFLVAYIVPASGQVPAIDKLRRDLQGILPSYMVPSSFVFLERLPLTSNGKIDRATLPAVSSQRSEMEQPFHAPQTEMERRVVAIYKNVLKIDKVGIDDNFFDLGGNSLSLVEVHSRLQDVVGRPFSVAELFAYTTVRKLAAQFSNSGRAKDAQNQLLSRAQRQRQAMVAGRDRRRQ
jgi:amino acid adenylation domain-containing protein